jgi:EAL domain-containing protein (putative c-di-GMP-specific phosphodiesterase class I)
MTSSTPRFDWSLAQQAFAALDAIACEIDARGHLTWLDEAQAVRVFGSVSPPATLEALDRLTQGAARRALASGELTATSRPAPMELSASPGAHILAIRRTHRMAGDIMPNPANDPADDPANHPAALMLTRALAEKRMCLFRQPIVSSSDARIVRWECLSRLVHEDGSIAQPFEYIPAAERAGLVGALDIETLDLALASLNRSSTIALAVNVSAATIADQGAREDYLHRLALARPYADRLTVEITETIAITDLDIAARFGHSARAAGARLALDDFGEGHTSFRSLRVLPLDEVKIDGLYVEAIDRRDDSRAFVNAIFLLARDLGLETVAERVETAQEAAALKGIGIGNLQGYFYGKPRASGH